MTEKNEIIDLIEAAQHEMMNFRKHESANDDWLDNSAKESGKVMRMEALLAFLVPLNKLESYKNKFFKNFPEDELKKECLDLIKDIEKEEEDVRFFNPPYVRIIDTDNNQHGFISAACYVIKLIVNYDQLWGIVKNNKKVFQSVFQAAIEFVDRCAVTGKQGEKFPGEIEGYQFTDYGSRDDAACYTTWIVLDTLNDLPSTYGNLTYVNAASKKLLEKAKKRHKKLLLYFEKKHLVIHEEDEAIADFYGVPKDKDASNLYLIKKEIKYNEGDNFIHYNLWILMILLYLGSNKQEELYESINLLSKYINPGIERMYEKVAMSPWTLTFENSKIKKTNEHTDGTLNFFEDKSFLPQHLKMLALLADRSNIPPEELSDHFEQSYNGLLDNRITEDGKPVPYWDKYSTKEEHFTGYSIYYTQRAIESLCEYYLFLDSTDKKSISQDNTGYSLPELEALKKILTAEKDDYELKINKMDMHISIDEQVTKKFDELAESLITAVKKEMDPLSSSVNRYKTLLDELIKLLLESQNTGKGALTKDIDRIFKETMEGRDS